MPKRESPEISARDQWWLRGFQAYTAYYLRRHFHAVRLREKWPAVPTERPLVVYLNHPSWWDPLICLQLARTLCPERTNFAPMDAAMLARYRLFRRFGFFAVEAGTARGARQFLHASTAILQRPHTSLWLTPQGRFADVRERPLTLASGLDHLAQRCPEAVYLPLALEFTFWNERRPEALACFGVPAESPADLSRHLQAAQEELAIAAQTRDDAQFTTILQGKAGEGGVYELWRRVRSLWQREPFEPAHLRTKSSA